MMPTTLEPPYTNHHITSFVSVQPESCSIKPSNRAVGVSSPPTFTQLVLSEFIVSYTNVERRALYTRRTQGLIHTQSLKQLFILLPAMLFTIVLLALAAVSPVLSAPVPPTELTQRHEPVVAARHDSFSPGAPHHKAAKRDGGGSGHGGGDGGNSGPGGGGGGGGNSGPGGDDGDDGDDGAWL